MDSLPVVNAFANVIMCMDGMDDPRSLGDFHIVKDGSFCQSLGGVF